MMKLITIAILMLISPVAEGQLKDQLTIDLSRMQSVDSAKNYLVKHPTLAGQLFELNSRKDTSDFDKELLLTDVGDLIDFDSEDKTKHFFFKTLEVTQVRAFRVQYIFLDNSKLTIEQIDSTRKVILKKINQGESFDKLAQKYSMDNNSKNDGDLDWFQEGEMISEFEKAVKKRKIGEVYQIDIPSQKWYYLVKNTHEPVTDKKMILLYIEIKKGS